MEADRQRKPTKRDALRRVWANVQILMAGRMYRLWLLSGISIVGGFAEAGVLYLVVRIAVALAGGESSIDFHLGPVHTHVSLTATVVLGAVGVLFITVLALIETVLSARMSADVLTDSRKTLFADFVRSRWSVQSMEREGQLQEFMTTYVARVAASIAIFTGGLISAFNFLALLTSAFLVDPVAASGSLIGFVLVFLMLRPLVRMSKAASRHNAAVNSAYARSMTQTVSLAREVHVFDVGDELISEADRLADQARASTYRTRILSGMTSEVYRNVTLLIVLLGMGAAYAIGLSEVSQLGAVVLLLVRSLSYSQQVQGSVQAAAELAPYLDGLQEQQDLYRASRINRDGRDLGAVEHLELRHVDFSYNPGHPVLRDVSFAVPRGAVVGIVGPSGSGKSTLVQILLRLRTPDDGLYLVNGAPADEVGLGPWYDQFVFVPQDNRLVFASVADNIAFYRAGVDREQVVHAADLAHIREEIEQLPEGFDTIIGPGGHDLSGGQKQRLGLARALVGRPSVLVLDEPTSALDLHSEQLVQRTLQDLRGEVTLFIVAHRLSTLSICDHVLVLRDGSVEGFGAPDDLRSADGFYREALQILASSERSS